MNMFKVFCAPIGVALFLMPVLANSASNFSITNSGGFVASTERNLIRALTDGESTLSQGAYVSQRFVTGSFAFDASSNVLSGSDPLGTIYNGAVSNFLLRIADQDDEFVLNASLSVGGAIVGDQKLNAQDLVSLGGNQAASTNWNGFTACWLSSCYTLTSISVNYIGDDFVSSSQALPRGLPPVGYAETTNKNLALSLTFKDTNNVEHTVGTVVTVNCESVDSCPQLPSDVNPEPIPNPALIDTDGDGCMDNVDFFVIDASECKDTDRDGIGNNADLDDDGDGLSDDNEIVRGTNPLKLDSDADGLGDAQDGFPTSANDYVSTSGSIAEGLSIKGCIATGRTVPAKLNFMGALFTAEVGDQWLPGLAAAAGKKTGISINGDGQAQILKSLRAWAPGCTINAITGQKVGLTFNKAKTQAKLDAKITVSASVLVKGKPKIVKGTYTMRSMLPWSPTN
jgi:hypothetical protein